MHGDRRLVENPLRRGDSRLPVKQGERQWAMLLVGDRQCPISGEIAPRGVQSLRDVGLLEGRRAQVEEHDDELKAKEEAT